METVLWIGRDAAGSETLTNAAKFRVFVATKLSTALEILRGNRVEAILAQLPIDQCPAEELITQIRDAGHLAPIVVYEPNGLISTQAPRNAFQYIPQAVTVEELHQALIAAIRHGGGNETTQPQPVDGWRNLLVGSSAAVRDVVETIRLVGNRRCTVLITGETGTGKEVAARAIHLASGRAKPKMVAINCAALPDHLLEAELFGHTKGAFTGAVNARVGLFEQAQRGTIFLDEIGEMPMQLQAKLLRVLQEREVQRIGSSETVPVDVRVIAASNSNLGEAVAHRRFREDLYYRLNVVALRMPTLRERASDVPELVEHFLRKIAEQESARPKEISPAAVEMLVQYAWPGNVRQLENALESAVALSDTRIILQPSDFDLPSEFDSLASGHLSSLDVPESGLNFEELIMGIERRLLERALHKSGGNKARAANMLHMKRTTLISKFKSLEVCA